MRTSSDAVAISCQPGVSAARRAQSCEHPLFLASALMGPPDTQRRLLFVALLFMLFIAPFDEGAGRGLVPLTAVTITSIILATSLVRRRLVPAATRTHSPLALPLLVFFGIAAASVIWSIDRYVTLTGVATVLACAVAALAVLWEFNAPRQARGLCVALVVLACLLVPPAILQCALGRGGFVADGVARAHSVFVTPNTFGGFLIIVLPVAVSLALTSGRRAARLLLWGAAALLAAALLQTQSRGAWAAGLGGMLVLAWQLRRARAVGIDRRSLLTAGLLLAVLLGGLTLTGQGPRMGSRAASLLRPHEAATFRHRTLYWQAGLEMAALNLPLGIGLDTFHIDYRAHQRPPLAGTVQWYAHNDYLQLFIELGPLGLLAFLWLLGRVGRMASEVLRTAEDRADKVLIAGCCAGAAGALLHSLVDYDLYVSATALPLFVLFGIIAAYHARLGPTHRSALTSDAARLPSLVGTVREPPGRRVRSLLRHGVLALGTAAVVLAVRPLVAETLLQRSRFNAPYAVALCPPSAHLWCHLGDVQAGRHLAPLGAYRAPADAGAALASYRRAVELSPRDAYPRARLRDLLRRTAKLSHVPAENGLGPKHLHRACAVGRTASVPDSGG